MVKGCPHELTLRLSALDDAVMRAGDVAKKAGGAACMWLSYS